MTTSRSIGAGSEADGLSSVFTCLYRAGTGGSVKEGEGTRMALPGSCSERTWSGSMKNYVRNVEAEGSSPFTSTRSPVQRPSGGPPHTRRSRTWALSGSSDFSGEPRRRRSPRIRRRRFKLEV